jgi:hypothetical protein
MDRRILWHGWGRGGFSQTLVILLLTRNLVKVKVKIIGLNTIKITVVNSLFLTVGYHFAFDIYLDLTAYGVNNG